MAVSGGDIWGARSIKEAVATYTSWTAGRLRAQQSVCKRLRLSILTGMSASEAKFTNDILVDLTCSTDDSRLRRKVAREGGRVLREASAPPRLKSFCHTSDSGTRLPVICLRCSAGGQ